MASSSLHFSYASTPTTSSSASGSSHGCTKATLSSFIDIKQILSKKARALERYDSVQYRNSQQNFWELPVVKEQQDTLRTIKEMHESLKRAAAALRALNVNITVFGRLKSGKSTTLKSLLNFPADSPELPSAELPCTPCVITLHSAPESQKRIKLTFFPIYTSVEDIETLWNTTKWNNIGLTSEDQTLADNRLQLLKDLFTRGMVTVRDPHTPVTVEVNETEMRNAIDPPAWARDIPIIMSIDIFKPIRGIDLLGFSISDCPGTTENSALTAVARNAAVLSSLIVFVAAVNDPLIPETTGSSDINFIQSLQRNGHQVMLFINARHENQPDAIRKAEATARATFGSSLDIQSFNILSDENARHSMKESMLTRLSEQMNQQIVNFLQIFDALAAVQRKYLQALLNLYTRTTIASLSPIAGLPVVQLLTSKLSMSQIHPKSSLVDVKQRYKEWLDIQQERWQSVYSNKLSALRMSMDVISVHTEFKDIALDPYIGELRMLVLREMQPVLQDFIHEFIVFNSLKLRASLKDWCQPIAKSFMLEMIEAPKAHTCTPLQRLLASRSNIGHHGRWQSISNPVLTGAVLNSVSDAVFASGASVAHQLITSACKLVSSNLLPSKSWFTPRTKEEVTRGFIANTINSLLGETELLWKRIRAQFDLMADSVLSALETQLLSKLYDNLCDSQNIEVPKNFPSLDKVEAVVKCIMVRDELESLQVGMTKALPHGVVPASSGAAALTCQDDSTPLCVLCKSTIDTCPHLCRSCNFILARHDCPKCFENKTANVPLEISDHLDTIFKGTAAPAADSTLAEVSNLSLSLRSGISPFSTYSSIHGRNPDADSALDAHITVIIRCATVLKQLTDGGQKSTNLLLLYQLYLHRFLHLIERDWPHDRLGQSRTMELMERRLAAESADVLHTSISSALAQQDAEFYHSIAYNLNSEDWEKYFSKHRSKWVLAHLDAAAALIRRADECTMPYQKFICFSKAWSTLENASWQAVSQEEKTDAFSVIILKAQPKRLLTTFQMIVSCLSTAELHDSTMLKLLRILTVDRGFRERVQDFVLAQFPNAKKVEIGTSQ